MNTGLPSVFTTISARNLRRPSNARRLIALLAAAIFGALFVGHTLAGTPNVKLVRAPDGGIQPQAAIDRDGVVHLIYFKGKAGAGDIFYVCQKPGEENFSEPIRVNTRRGSAIAVGTIRGAQMAVGRNGRVHVAWNGVGESDYMKTPMLYARFNDAGTAFEPERDVITFARGLDGGGSIAADNQGNVYVTWHAPKPGNTEGEAGRAVFMARSTDDGKTFAPEKEASPKQTGACGCCGMKAFADNQGNLFALYRAASEKVNRDEILLVSKNRGTDFEVINAAPWNVAACPMSSASLGEVKDATLAAWETEGQVFFARVDPKTFKVSSAVSPPGKAKRKHPVAVGNSRGDVLLAWAEGTAWERGGTVSWQVFDAKDQPAGEIGRNDGVPAWSLVAAVPQTDGSFVVIY